MDPGIILINNAVRVMDILFTIEDDMIQGPYEFNYNQAAIAIIRSMDLSSGQIKTDKSFCSIHRLSATKILFTWLTYPTQKTDTIKGYAHKIMDSEQIQCTNVLFNYTIGRRSGVDENAHLQEYIYRTCCCDSDSESDDDVYIKFFNASPVVYTWKKEVAHVVQGMLSYVIAMGGPQFYEVHDNWAFSYYKISDNTIMCSVVCFPTV